MNGKSVLLAAPGITGWAPIDQVVPLEQADSFFAKPDPGQSRRIVQSH